MTGPEREDFRELRSEMREGFLGLERGLAVVAERVTSLETTRAEQDAVDSDRADRAVERRNRITVFLAAAATTGALLGALLQFMRM